jgi:peptidoglycan/LPS O-acetylase OafA/YrhL
LFVAVIGLHLYMDITGWLPAGSLLGQIVGYPPFWATVLPFYLAGTLFQVYGGPSLLRLPWLTLAAVLLVASNFVPHGLLLTTPTCGAYLLMGLAYLPWLHPLNLGRFGDFSYGTYLYAYPIQQLLILRAHGNISPWLLFAEATPLTLVVGALSWFLVERHFLQRRSILKHEGILPPEPAARVDSLSTDPDRPSAAPVTAAQSRNSEPVESQLPGALAHKEKPIRLSGSNLLHPQTGASAADPIRQGKAL